MSRRPVAAPLVANTTTQYRVAWDCWNDFAGLNLKSFRLRFVFNASAESRSFSNMCVNVNSSCVFEPIWNYHFLVEAVSFYTRCIKNIQKRQPRHWKDWLGNRIHHGFTKVICGIQRFAPAIFTLSHITAWKLTETQDKTHLFLLVFLLLWVAYCGDVVSEKICIKQNHPERDIEI